jgi:hypothetical protein
MLQFPIRYVEWFEERQAEGRIMHEQIVSAPELFIRKLVNATVLRNQLFEHTSHESEDGRRHLVYAKPYTEYALAAPYGSQLLPAVLGGSITVSAELESELYGWNGRRFAPIQLPWEPRGMQELGLMLLDHYIVTGSVTHESLYTVLDSNRNKLLFFLKEVNG